MAQWTAVLVALVCLSGSSSSRSWIGFDYNDGSRSWQAYPDDYGQNRKSRYYSGEDSWQRDDYEDSGYENGYEHSKPISSNDGYQKDHDSHYQDYHHVGHHPDHGYNGNWGHYGHHHHHGSPGQPDQYWRDIGHHRHSTSSDQPGDLKDNWGSQGHHDQTGYGQPGEKWVSHGHQGQTRSPEQHQQNWGPHGHNTQRGNYGQPGQSTGPSRGLPQNNVSRPRGSGNDADRIVFPDLNNQVSTTRSPPTNKPATTTARTISRTTVRTTTTDRTLIDLVICIRACPNTPEYNPVCGTNNVTYNNPGALQCAKNCGLNVAVARQAPCPRVVPPSTTTARPITNPTITTTSPTPGPPQSTVMRTTTYPTLNTTRFTNINFMNKPAPTPIPLEILQSVFGIDSNAENPEYDIDRIRDPRLTI